MVSQVRGLIALLVLLVLLVGCSGDGAPPLPAVDNAPDDILITSRINDTSVESDSHRMWLNLLIYVDPTNPDDIKYEIVPLRDALAHWNILTWLEQGPCYNCFKLISVQLTGYGTIRATIELTHPFDNPNFTGFDVRGIPMFAGTGLFPVSGLSYSNLANGDAELINADGYTSLYNVTTAGSGPNGTQGYIEGNLATTQPPDALLNGYKRHISTDALNTRNAFYAGDTVEVIYEIDLPDGPLLLGYAVDACWAPATTQPVTDPMSDFPPDANCPESWKIEVNEIPVLDGLTECGGQTVLTIDCYDWQGPDNVNLPTAECPGLLDGITEFEWLGDSGPYSRYTLTIDNDDFAPAGVYPCLISKEAQENDPIGKPWLDLTAYQLIRLEVSEKVDMPPTAMAEADQYVVDTGQTVTFSDTGSHDNDCGGNSIVEWEWDWNNDGIFDEVGVIVSHSWSTEGAYEVQFRVTDDEGSSDTLDQPLEIIVGEIAFDLEDVTPPYLNIDMYGVVADGSTALVLAEDESHIFDISDPSSPVWIKSFPLTSYFDYSASANNGYAYLIDFIDGLTVIDISPPESAAIIHTDPAITGWSIVSEGSYACVADNSLFQVVNISNPYSPTVVGVESIPASNPVYMAASGGYVYINDLNGPFLIIDVSNPSDPELITTDETISMSRAIAASDGYVFASCYDADPVLYGIRIIDVNDPEAPFVAITINLGGSNAIWSMAVSNGYLYTAASEGGVHVLDIDPPLSTHIVHNIDSHGEAKSVSVTGNNLCLTDFGGLRMINITDPENAQITGSYRAIMEPEDISINGHYAYIADGYGDFKILDLDQPENTFVAGMVETEGQGYSVSSSCCYAYFVYNIADTWPYIAVIDIGSPETAHIVNTPYNGGYDYPAYSDGYVYYTQNQNGIQIVDVDPPEATHDVKLVDFSCYIFFGLSATGDYAYALEDNDLHILDVNPPEDASVINTVETYGWDSQYYNGYAFVSHTDGFDIIDVDPPETAGYYDTFTCSMPYVIVAEDGYLYVSTWTHLEIYDIDPIDNIQLVASLETTNAWGMDVDSGIAIIRQAHSNDLAIISLY